MIQNFFLGIYVKGKPVIIYTVGRSTASRRALPGDSGRHLDALRERCV